MRNHLRESVNQSHGEFATTTLVENLNLATVPLVPNVVKRGGQQLITNDAYRMTCQVQVKCDLLALPLVTRYQRVSEPRSSTVDSPLGLPRGRRQPNHTRIAQFVTTITDKRHDRVESQPTMSPGGLLKLDLPLVAPPFQGRFADTDRSGHLLG